MRVGDVTSVLESIAPAEYAEEWDNVGLLIGSPAWSVSRAMLTIDLTEPVLDEAAAAGTQLVVAYHPPIFEPLRTLTDRTVSSRIALRCAGASIAVYSPHTALDAAPGGVNDWLAEGLGAGDVRALTTYESLPATEECKLVTFCPAPAVDRLRNALAAAGAGRIGEYELCSFEITGRGTFRGGDGTSPAVGRRGTLERVDEIRLEMVCPRAALGIAAWTLREFHPYEEPPIEIYALRPRPVRHVGAGRRLTLDRPRSLDELVQRVKTRLGVSRVRVAVGRGVPRRYRTIGLCAGAGGSLLGTALEQGCRMFLTGEMRHLDVLAAQARGCTVVLAGHTNTERGYLKRLRTVMTKRLPDLDVRVARRDRDPLRLV